MSLDLEKGTGQTRYNTRPAFEIVHLPGNDPPAKTGWVRRASSERHRSQFSGAGGNIFVAAGRLQHLLRSTMALFSFGCVVIALPRANCYLRRLLRWTLSSNCSGSRLMAGRAGSSSCCLPCLSRASPTSRGASVAIETVANMANQKFATYFLPSFPPPIQAFGG